MPQWVIFTHGDSDGVVSGSIAKAFLERRGDAVNVVFTHPAGLYGDLREFHRPGHNIFISDIALDEISMENIARFLNEVSREARVIYIDHHPLLAKPEFSEGVEFVHDICCSASELAFRYFLERGLDEEYGRVALYGAIGDYLDITPWAREELAKWDKRVIFFEAGVLIQGLEGSKKDHEFKRKVAEVLADNKLPSAYNELVERSVKQSQGDEKLRLWVKANVSVTGSIAYVLDPPGSVGRAANYARIYGKRPVGLAGEIRGDLIIMSLRGAQSIDLNYILRWLSKELGVQGGGHPQAAGCRVKKEQFALFLQELNKAIEKYSNQ